MKITLEFGEGGFSMLNLQGRFVALVNLFSKDKKVDLKN
jgi:hypothetical protein